MNELERHLVLVGAGHSHIEVLRRLAMAPEPGLRVTLVTDSLWATYSGMVPEVVADGLPREALSIDVWPLARRAGATVVHATLVGIDPQRQRLSLAGRPELAYDLCSLDIGSTVAGADLPGVREYALATRPLAGLLDGVDALRGASLAVVGGGAAGVELACALRGRDAAAKVTLVTASSQLVPGLGRRVARRLATLLRARGIALRLGEEVAAVDADGVRLVNGEYVAAQRVVWAAGAAAHAVLRDSPLPTDERGFVWVRDDLSVPGCPGLFAAGDCAVPRRSPRLPRSGVYAVRMGPYLHHNLLAAHRGRPTTAYKPQTDALALINLGDGTALAAKWGLCVNGAWVHRLKQRIDGDFITRYRPAELPRMEPMEMACRGCAAKLPPVALQEGLGIVPGTVGEDAARLPGRSELVWTVDAFPAFSDDAYFVAQVAAGHALADLWCKGARPTAALAVVTLPEARPAALAQVMAGLRAVLEPRGIALLGGHTATGPELVVGLTALGEVRRFVGLDGAEAGDVLLLTGALGTGLALRGDAMGRLSADEAMALNGQLLAVDDALVDQAPRLTAATDVSGFGLAHHLLDLCRASACGAELDLAAVAVLPGVERLLAEGLRSTADPANRAAAAPWVLGEHPRRDLLFDPQTGGGTLVAVSAEHAEVVSSALAARQVGRLVPGDPLVRLLPPHDRASG